MLCPFNNCGNNDNIPQFDTAVDHLIISVDIQGNVHVHGPFDNSLVMKRMFTALIRESKKHGINYVYNEIEKEVI